ncbi:hypothetical protein AAKU67_004167 [Oxalobacteraceae bacterium GrIS 2.11]
MTTVVIEHVALNDLPAAWRARLPVAAHSRVTVRIEEEPEAASTASVSDNPLFGLWQDRDDLTDVETYARQSRAPRHHSKD